MHRARAVQQIGAICSGQENLSANGPIVRLPPIFHESDFLPAEATPRSRIYCLPPEAYSEILGLMDGGQVPVASCQEMLRCGLSAQVLRSLRLATTLERSCQPTTVHSLATLR